MRDKRIALSLASIFILSLALVLPSLASASMVALDAGQHASSPARVLRDGVWSGTLHVFQTLDRSRSPVIVSAGDGLHAVWEEGSTLYHSTGDGNTWTEPSSIQIAEHGEYPAMAVDRDGRPHLVWTKLFEDRLQVFHSVWNGESWTPPQRIRETTERSGPPDIAIALAVGQQIHVVWADHRDGQSLIYCAESDDGIHWSDTSWILPRPTGTVPAVAVGDDGSVHVAWQDQSESDHDLNDVYYCLRSPGGDWSQLAENVSHSPLSDSQRPDLVLDTDGQVHLVWEEGTNVVAHVLYASGSSGNWSTPLALSETPSAPPLPCIATDGHDLFVAWESDARILCRQWRAGTGAWAAPIALAENESGVRDVSQWIDAEGFMHAVWTEKADGIWNIHYGRQLDIQPTLTPTATTTPTAVPTLPSPTPRLTATATVSATATTSPTATPSATATHGVTPSATLTNTPSSTPEATPSPMSSPTPTASPSATITHPTGEPPDDWFFPVMMGSVPQGPPLAVTPIITPATKAPIPKMKDQVRTAAPGWGWTEPLNVSQADSQSGLLSGVPSRAPAIGVAPDGTVHVVWEEGSHIYHRYWDRTDWSTPTRVATGERPSVVVDRWGEVHVAFANEFGGNMEIYYVRCTGQQSWSLPSNVSGTSGASSNPDIGLSSDGVLHIVWTDTSPGHSVLYHGYGNGLQWSTWPIPNATGTQPSVAVDSTGIVKVAWQDKYDPQDPYEIYYARRDGSGWSIPVCVDDTVETDSVSCDLQVGIDDRAHVVWQEDIGGSAQVHYCEQNEAMWWLVPSVLSAAGQDARLPAIGAGPLGDIHVAWDETVRASYRRFAAASSEWTETSTISSHSEGIFDVALGTNGQREAHVVWTQHVGEGDSDIFYSRQVLSLPHRFYMPLTLSQ